MTQDQAPTPRFTGIFIPVEILEMEEITPLEQMLLSWIDALFCKERGGCFATNEYLSKRLRVKENTIAKSLTNLRKLGLIKDISFDGRHRVIKACISEYVEKRQSNPALDLNPTQPWIKIQPCFGQKSKALPRDLPRTDSKEHSKDYVKEDNVFREPDKPRQEVETMETVSFFVDQKKTVSEALAKRWALNQHQLISLNYLLEQHVPAAPPTLAFWAKTYSLERLQEIVAYAKSQKPDNLAAYIQKLLRKNVTVENAVALKNREVAEYFAKAHMPGRLKVLKRYCVLTLSDGVTYDLEYEMDSETFYRALECKI